MGRRRESNHNLPPRMHVKGGSYYHVSSGKPRKWTKLGNDLNEARRKWAEFEDESVKVDDRTFHVIGSRFIKEVLPTLRAHTQRDYTQYFKLLDSVFGNLPIDQIRPFDIAEYVRVRGESSKVRANREKALFSTIFNHASLRGNIDFQNGMPKSRIKMIGVDVDANTHILGKANLLIHLVEKVRDPSVTPASLNQLMAETLVLMNTNETLGALEFPPIDSVDLIMTNPPYVTQGSKIYKDELKGVQGNRNGQLLSEYYENTGLGLESLFLRYITGALKPGGRAFVIVPQGMLSRSETSTKLTVLKECNLAIFLHLVDKFL